MLNEPIVRRCVDHDLLAKQPTKNSIQPHRASHERVIRRERRKRVTKISASAASQTPNLQSMPTLTKLYTMKEAAQHSTKNDCWVVIDGKVYDVSSYLDDHPGGDDVVLASTGKDATDDFEDAGHSKDARDLMETFCVGELDTSSTSAKEQLTVNSQKLAKLAKQYWAAPVAIVGISVVVGFLYLRKK